MGLLDNMAAGLAGYAVSEISKSHPLRDAIDEKLKGNKSQKSLRDIIAEYANARGIYTTSNELADELHKIARYYEGYDYDRYYDR